MTGIRVQKTCGKNCGRIQKARKLRTKWFLEECFCSAEYSGSSTHHVFIMNTTFSPSRILSLEWYWSLTHMHFYQILWNLRYKVRTEIARKSKDAETKMSVQRNSMSVLNANAPLSLPLSPSESQQSLNSSQDLSPFNSKWEYSKWVKLNMLCFAKMRCCDAPLILYSTMLCCTAGNRTIL